MCSGSSPLLLSLSLSLSLSPASLVRLSLRFIPHSRRDAMRRLDNRSRLDALIIYQAARVTGDRPIKLKQEAGSWLSALQRPSLYYVSTMLSD